MFIQAVLSQKFDDFKAGVDLITSNTIRLEGKLHEGMKQAAAQELSLIQAPSFTKDRLRAVRNQQKGGSKQEQEAGDFRAAVGKQNVEKGGEIEVRGSSLATKSVDVPSSMERASLGGASLVEPSPSAKGENEKSLQSKKAEKKNLKASILERQRQLDEDIRRLYTSESEGDSTEEDTAMSMGM
jgi:hypothetical protein